MDHDPMVTQWQDELLEEAFRELSDWQRAHPKATFAEIEDAVEERVADLRARLTEDLVRAKASAREASRGTDARPCCSACGKPMESRGERERTITVRGNRQVRVRRPYTVCPACGAGLFPLDEELELAPGAFSPRLCEGIVRLGALIPFEQVGETLAQFTNVEIGAETARALTERAGAALAEEQRAEAERLRRECPESPMGPPVQQLSADGAMVPLVGGEWAEVKTLAIGAVQDRAGRGGAPEAHTVELSYFSPRLANATEFAELALPELHRRGTEKAGRVCAVMDGAEWLQHFVDRYRPDAIRILDFPHAAEHLGTAAQAVFGAGTAEASEWLGIQLHELKHGDPDRVLTALRALPVGTDEARGVRDGVVSYLDKRRAQIAYAEFQATGYPIGSGIVESGNKLVVEVRLKGSGMHWARDNVNPMLTLRCALCSGRWSEAWGPIWQGLRRQQRERRCRRRQDRSGCLQAPEPRKATRRPAPAFPDLPKLPPTGTMVDGRPTANHPWRKTTLSRTPRALAPSAKL